jgi:hypothetical protein
MARYQDLPAELWQSIFKHVVCSFVWLEPPDVDAINPDDWLYPPQPPAKHIHPVTWHAHRVESVNLLEQLYLVNKLFQADAKYVWTHLVEPKLFPILNIDLVGYGTSTHRPLTGTMVKWLCLPTTFANIDTIEVHVRFLTHHT